MTTTPIQLRNNQASSAKGKAVFHESVNYVDADCAATWVEKGMAKYADKPKAKTESAAAAPAAAFQTKKASETKD